MEPSTSAFPTVSVILPTYDRGSTLRTAIESVLAQKHDDLEVIVVDDASTDDTASVIAQVDDRRLRCIVRDVRGGAARARNTALSHARGRFVAFQDSDDAWRPGFLGAMVDVLAHAPASVAVAYAAIEKRYLDGTIRRVPDPVHAVSGEIGRQLVHENFIALPPALVRADVLAAVGGFDERLSRLEDWDLWLSLAGRGCRFAYVDLVGVDVAETAGSVTSDRLAYFAAIELILEKHAALFAAEPAARMLYELQLARHYVVGGRFGRGARHVRAAVGSSPRRAAEAVVRKLLEVARHRSGRS